MDCNTSIIRILFVKRQQCKRFLLILAKIMGQKKVIRVRPVIRVCVNVGKRTNHLSRRALP